MNTHARRIPRPLGRGLDAQVQIDIFSARVEDSPQLAAGSFNFFVRVPGSCGELAQGWIDGVRLHISCPVNRYTRASLDEKKSAQKRLGPKVRKALQLAETSFGEKRSTFALSLCSGLPVGKGMASSTADVAAALAAYQFMARSFVDIDETARLALAVEPTDGVIFEGITLFDHYRGTVRKRLGSPPPLDILAIEFGETVDTVAFNQRDHRRVSREQTRTVVAAFDLIDNGVREGCVRKIGEGATLSALAHQNMLRKPDLERILKWTLDLGGVGVNVAHSGSMIGMFFRPGTYRLKEIRRRIWGLLRRPLPIYPLRLRGGGIEVRRTEEGSNDKKTTPRADGSGDRVECREEHPDDGALSDLSGGWFSGGAV